MPRSLRIACMGLAATGASFGAAAAGTPPIECRSAKGDVALSICRSPELRAMDREISALNDRGMVQLGSDNRELAQSQFRFFKRRNGCVWASHHSAHPGPAVDECVRSIMEGRLRVLRGVVDGANARR
jgi:uncharacterized protein